MLTMLAEKRIDSGHVIQTYADPHDRTVAKVYLPLYLRDGAWHTYKRRPSRTFEAAHAFILRNQGKEMEY